MLKHERGKPREPDVLGRDEPDPVERLKTIARDGLAHKDDDAVEREIHGIYEVMGWHCYAKPKREKAD
jgi:hypothetical protein